MPKRVQNIGIVMVKTGAGGRKLDNVFRELSKLLVDSFENQILVIAQFESITGISISILKVGK